MDWPLKINKNTACCKKSSPYGTSHAHMFSDIHLVHHQEQEMCILWLFWCSYRYRRCSCWSESSLNDWNAIHKHAEVITILGKHFLEMSHSCIVCCLLFKKRGGFTARPGVLKLQQLSLNFGESCVRGLSSFPPWGLQNPYCENSGGLLNLFFVCTFFSTIVQFCTRVIKFLLLGSPWALAQSWALRHQRKTMRNSLAQNPRLPCVEVQRCKCHVL